MGLLALRATGHFHGSVACDVEGRPFRMDDFTGYSSESVADSASVASGFSDHSDIAEEEESEDEDEVSNMDSTLVGEELGAAHNKFALLSIDSD